MANGEVPARGNVIRECLLHTCIFLSLNFSLSFVMILKSPLDCVGRLKSPYVRLSDDFLNFLVLNWVYFYFIYLSINKIKKK